MKGQGGLLHGRGAAVSHGIARVWQSWFGSLFAERVRRKRASRLRAWLQWQWRLNAALVKINGVTHFLGRAADYEGQGLG